ncbi:cytidine deaminase-like protein [Kickxella alabastrina]|uniref:cytidine deaminase-like protein n=1 Tax=Kickxella alabastrina TaxID=61397 RepID=UPI00222047A0|nr:cytidine deaminase-like protein [Kickxella alabastrina]KAI7825894.1 cytidine deaminase-like protein [Kickxella alabastrina]KAJ1947254.1 tRNA(adenine34) deaminase [Kickxella alabastrina]
MFTDSVPQESQDFQGSQECLESQDTHTQRLTHMRQALNMAQEALQNNEVPVGCVFIHHPTNKQVGQGRNETNLSKNGTRHAEIVAIDLMIHHLKYTREQFAETDLYVTVEPCIMCAAALRLVGIGRVFFGCGNERFGGCGSVLGVHQGVVDGREYVAEGGFLKDEAVLLLRQFYIKENTEAPQPRKKANRVLKTGDLNVEDK